MEWIPSDKLERVINLVRVAEVEVTSSISAFDGSNSESKYHSTVLVPVPLTVNSRDNSWLSLDRSYTLEIS